MGCIYYHGLFCVTLFVLYNQKDAYICYTCSVYVIFFDLRVWYIMSRAALAILSTENLLHNLSIIKQKSGTAQVMAMVKANAYGHGLRSVAKRLDAHVDNFGVASIDEALALRKVGIKKPITLLEGVFEPDELLVASCERFQVVFHDHEQLRWLRSAVVPLPLMVWIKIDTGLGRLGFSLDEYDIVYQQLAAHAYVHKPIGLMSHFACSDQPDHELNVQQQVRFAQLAARHAGPKSFANSGALWGASQPLYDLVRPGIALYGVSPYGHLTASSLNLKPVMTLQTRLVAVRTVQKGSSIGYGARSICPEDMPLGVVAMGYGDGYPRSATDGTPVLVKGIRCPLIGRVSMDMMTIDLRNCPTACVGDPVILWGDGLSLETVAPFAGRIPYEMLTAVQTRVRFHWTLCEE